MAVNPKVFISHASEDKERFVIGFASKLRQIGIDAWLDRWEMLPGDSLVDKIFEEGIRNASAVIVVLSRYSVEKPWVREELNAAVIKKIESGSKLIPVVIDDCEVPEVLKSTVWERIADLANYEPSFVRIVDAIYGQSRKPPIGQQPLYVAHDLVPVAGLTATDTQILKASCELVIDTHRDLIDPRELPAGSVLDTVPPEVFKESADMLAHHGLIEQLKVFGTALYPYSITLPGFETYCQHFFPNYREAVVKMAFELVNDKPRTNVVLQERVRIPLRVVDHVLSLFELHDYVLMSKSLSIERHIVDVRTTLKRALSEYGATFQV